jgi:ubiquinone/menaquinone biosynthesis C-methylase UbiE
MSATSPVAGNHWFDRRCARAFWSQHELPPYQQLLRHTIAWLDPAPGQYWLDLGCGCGQLSRALWDKSAGQLEGILALDCAATNAKALEALRASYSPPIAPERLRFQQADFSLGLVGLPSERFDGVVSGLAIQYAQHYCPRENRWTETAYDRLLTEVARVLRPGGQFLFSVNVPNPAWLRVAVHSLPALFTTRRPLRFLRNSLRMMRYGNWLTRESARGRFHYLPAERIQEKLLQAGFTQIEYRLSYSRQAYLFRARRAGKSAL